MKPNIGRCGRPIAPRAPIDTAALRAARIEREMSGRELAETLTQMCGRAILYETYRGWERGLNRPPKDVRAALESILGIGLVAEGRP